jgi:hypothetical protein
MIVLTHYSSLCCRINDRVISANNISLEGVDYATAVQVIKETVSRATFAHLWSSFLFPRPLCVIFGYWLKHLSPLLSLHLYYYFSLLLNLQEHYSSLYHIVIIIYHSDTYTSHSFLYAVLLIHFWAFLGARGGGAASQKSALSLFCYAVEKL